jgi:short-subunit dehydrogenase
MSAERCARIGLGALFHGRRSIVSGLLNSNAMFLTRFIPRRLATAIAAKSL